MDSEQEPAGPVLPLPQKYLADYTPYLSVEHPERQLLLPLFQRLPSIFELGVGRETTASKQKNPQVCLHIYTKEHPESNSNIFVYTFAYPGVTWDAYRRAAIDPVFQRQLDGNLSDYEVKALDESTQYIYQAYKKILFISPRDFSYIRHEFEAEGEHWVLAVSKPGMEEYFDRVRGDIIMTASRFHEEDGELRVSAYSHINMKLKMKPAATKPKAMLELTKLLDTEYRLLKQLQQ